MVPIAKTFEFDYFGSDIVYGRGAVDRLGSHLAGEGIENALVVCGTNVGANDALMDPVLAGLGDRLAGVFDETTPLKDAETVYDGITAMRDVDADMLVGVGGGSSLDIARQMSVFADDGRSLETFRDQVREGDLEPPEASEDATPVVVVPTTFAGADIADGGKVAVFTGEDSPTGKPIRTGGQVMPVGMFYDPALFETTPDHPLRGSAMNGFDKPLETLYARDGDPIVQSTAMHSLRLFSESLPSIPDDPNALDRAVVGIILAQFGSRIAIVHAFGQAISRRYPVHQGEVHAVVAPHVLQYLLSSVDPNRALLAEAFDVDRSLDDDAVDGAIVDEVIAVRDGLGLPTRLRDLEAVPQEEFPAIARHVLDNHNTENAPAGLNPTAEEIQAVLREAW